MIDPIPVNIECTNEVPMFTYFFCFSFDNPPDVTHQKGILQGYQSSVTELQYHIRGYMESRFFGIYRWRC